ncbi:restriction endonuclease S subunit [Bacteroidales bacterium 6E]|nr:restriction endonuclease S subunit [Bacteroidales bacterium 6E]
MDEWKDTKLEEVLDFGNGKVKPQNDGIIPIYGGNGILGFGDESNYKGETIIIGRVGAYCGSVYFENRPIWISDNALSAKPKGRNNTKFLYYFLKNVDLNQWAGGSSHPLVTQSLLNSLEFSICLDPEIQKSIASILSSLDDKIDLLHRQNQTLEKMAETLFRKWFVEEAKEDWVEGKFVNEFDFSMGASPPGESYNEEGNGIPMYQGNADFGFRFPTNRVFTTDPKRFAKKFDTIISVRAPVGEQNMANEECCIGRGVAAFRFKANNSFYSYTFYKIKSLMNDIKQFNETGTVFGSISKTDLENIEIMMPDFESIKRFQSSAKPIDDKIMENTIQIHSLTALRDTLLPKLMSGEVRV